jgi:dTDP-4-dehydrorhamnose reductase
VDGIITVATNLLASADPELRGIFHMTAVGDASWAEFATAVFDCSSSMGGPSAAITPIGTADYPTPARRPANSRLDCTRLEEVHGVRLPEWRSSLKEVVGRLVRAA